MGQTQRTRRSVCVRPCVRECEILRITQSFFIHCGRRCIMFPCDNENNKQKFEEMELLWLRHWHQHGLPPRHHSGGSLLQQAARHRYRHRHQRLRPRDLRLRLPVRPAVTGVYLATDHPHPHRYPPQLPGLRYGLPTSPASEEERVPRQRGRVQQGGRLFLQQRVLRLLRGGGRGDDRHGEGRRREEEEEEGGGGEPRGQGGKEEAQGHLHLLHLLLLLLPVAVGAVLAAGPAGAAPQPPSSSSPPPPPPRQVGWFLVLGDSTVYHA